MLSMENYYDAIELENLYQWVDSIPLSRPKNNIWKDFSDAVLVAEIIKHYFPFLVDVNNYHSAVGPKHKMENWFLLNRKVLQHLGIDLSEETIRSLANCKQNVIEKVLIVLRYQIDKYIEKYGAKFKARNNAAKSIEVILNTAQDLRYDEANTLTNQKSLAHSPVNAPVSDNVPRAMLNEKIMECRAKDETMQILTLKINKMEQLLQLKDTKIQQLEKQLEESNAKF
ncbi:sperm flagellar protein 1-like [Biomphalaria glabrata]|uniref:Sperm flagellar protein 1-like n=1 Tax=Biomphalaria glabrata TaxID=6526 RepID=A0A9W2YB09_BIOGL|nr:sperm flagellar protein 1-like [Biomphalaria glabrata]XP_055859879.1 sperm flagellar protein 1-like [Biomphalaria glabrata]KAI8769292.1 sperm flagellar protein 1 [Biomphalaria glabrata]